MRHYRPVDTGLGPYSASRMCLRRWISARGKPGSSPPRARNWSAHVGGRPNAVQARLIHQACQLALRIAMMDRKLAEDGEPTDHDSRTYLAWSAHYARLLAQLGMAAAPSQNAPGLPRLLSGMPTRPGLAAL